MVQRTAVSRWKNLKLFTQVHFNAIIVAKHLLTWDIPAHLVPFDTFCLDNRSTMINISATCDLLIRMFIHIYIYALLFYTCLHTYAYHIQLCNILHSFWIIVFRCEVRSTAIMISGAKWWQNVWQKSLSEIISKPKLFLRNLQPCNFDKDNALMGDPLIRCTFDW